jgi:protein-L-isoaspartate(D-aspartate) O-methyltransferase
MTEILKLTGGENVLEIGTGSGYQAAVLALTAGRVQTMEIVEPLAESARERLGSLGYPADVRAGDGYHGWPENAPYQAVIVTCAADHIPPPLIGQLAVGGRMIIPVGPAWGIQSLVLMEKESETSLKRSHLMAVRFVPLVTGR